MANISITRRCHRGCSYCFAKHELSRNLTADMSIEIYESALGFLERSGFMEARLLGGEPTIHPQFCAYVERAFERGFRVTVFSGGLVPRPVLDYLKDLEDQHFSLVLNTADPSDDPKSLVMRQLELCRELGQKIMLGVNIRSADENPMYLLDWVEKYDLCRTIRVGMAHPIWGGNNDFFRFRGPRIIPVFEQLSENAAKTGITIGFDCGFTPCMFSRKFVDAHLDQFMRYTTTSGEQSLQTTGCEGNSLQNTQEVFTQKEAIGVRCGSVVDIMPEGACIACYALSRCLRLPLPAEKTRNELVSTFDREFLSILPAGVHRECSQCQYLENGLCNGGCKARRAFRLRPDLSIPLNPELPARDATA